MTDANTPTEDKDIRIADLEAENERLKKLVADREKELSEQYEYTDRAVSAYTQLVRSIGTIMGVRI